MQLITLAAMPMLVMAAWLYTVSVCRSRFPMLRGKKICLLIAHPDDEAMFFAPTILALANPSLENHIKILCLSSGDADGLGDIRKRELVKSGLKLGLRSEEDVYIIESPDFPDSMTANWDAGKISAVLESAFTTSQKRYLTTSKPTTSIDVLITFDASGISSHPNHISLFHGARHYIGSLMKSVGPGWTCPVTLYTLTSISILRKYTSFLDAILSMAAISVTPPARATKPPPALLFLSGPRDLHVAQKAMTTAHQSQMRWFRWGWIGFSRYMVVNDLKLEKVSSA